MVSVEDVFVMKESVFYGLRDGHQIRAGGGRQRRMNCTILGRLVYSAVVVHTYVEGQETKGI